MAEPRGLPSPTRQQLQAHALGAGVSKRLATEYRLAVDEATKQVERLSTAAQARKAAGLPVPPSWALEQSHYTAMRDQMNSQLVKLNQTANTEIAQGKRDAVELAQTHSKDWIGESFRHLPASAVEEMVRQIHNARPGTPFGKALGQYPREVNKKMESILVQTVALGLGPREAVRLFKKEMAGPFRRYDNLARTEVMGAYTRASIASYRENREHLDGWEWVVEQTGNLCPFCKDKDGKVFPVTENFVSHPSCRCTTIPKLNDKALPPPPLPDPTPPPPVKPPPSAVDANGKPVREKGESVADYRKRIAAWTREQLAAAPKAPVAPRGRVGYERAIPPEVQALRQKIADLRWTRKATGAAAIRAHVEAHRLLELPADQQANFTVRRGSMGAALPGAQKTIMSQAEDAQTWLQRHMSRSVLDGQNVSVHYESDRAYYRGAGIYMAPFNGVRTYLHEMGHWVEDLHDDILEQSEMFLRRRAAGSPEWLGDLTGQRAYGKTEVAYPDTFIDPYVGKVYRGASEVISMGIEELYNDPVGFAQRDPEHFELTVAAMHGHTKTNTERRK